MRVAASSSEPATRSVEHRRHLSPRGMQCDVGIKADVSDQSGVSSATAGLAGIRHACRPAST